MESLVAYMPMDRGQALARGVDLPDRTSGAALFADVSGFTPLTEILVRELGPRRGADELTRQLNQVYDALIAEVHRYGGSVVTFGGDAIICWFDADPSALSSSSVVAQAAERATACALNMQRRMDQFSHVQISPASAVSLAIKAVVTAGPARRLLVGSPQSRYLDVIAGVTVDRLAEAAKQASKGEVLLGSEVISQLGDKVKILEWREAAIDDIPPRTLDRSVPERFAVVTAPGPPVETVEWPPLQMRSSDRGEDQTEATGLTLAQIRPWLLPPVYERLTTGGDRFLAELRTAVALFIRFGGLDYDRDDAALEKLDSYIRWVQTVLARYAGYLIQLTTGDKGTYLYTAFGAPRAYGDDAARAVAAALELGSPPPENSSITEVQIGISQGRMRVGPYGSTTRQVYGVQGSEVNVAARLMEQAKLGQVLISKRIAEAAAKNYHFTPIGSVTVKGKQEPIPVFEVANKRLSLSPRPIPRFEPQKSSAEPKTRQHFQDDLPVASPATTPDPKPAIVGRITERVWLAERLEQLVHDRVSSTVMIEGDAGIGKSRLVIDLLEQAQEMGVPSLVGGGTAIEQATAYHAWRPVFGQFFNLDTGTNTNTIIKRTQVLSLLPKAAELQRLVPLLNAVLPLRLQENDVTRQMTGQVRADNTHRLLIGLLQRAAKRSPMLLILEDAHWLDSASWALTRLVSQQVAPIFLVIVTRPLTDSQPESYLQIVQADDTHRLHLDALQPDEALQIVCQRLGINKLPETIATLIRTKAEGHPFFSEELAYALRDTGVIRVVNGECQIMAGIEHLDAVNLPDTIEDVITSRIDRLPPQHQLTLKVASVVGRVFSFRLLHDIHPIQADKLHLRDYLDTLEQLDITSIESLEPDLAYVFKHVITQEVAYNLMLFAQRWELHRAVAEWLERTYADDLSPFCALLAHHWSRAVQGQPENPNLVAKAIDYLEEAGEQALRSNANQEAVGFFSEALALDAKRIGWSPGELLRADGQITSGLQSPNLSVPLRRARWERQLGQAEMRLGNLLLSRRHLQRALTLLNRRVPNQNWHMVVGLMGQALRQALHRAGLAKLIRRGLANKAILLEAARVYERLGETYYWANETIAALYSALRTVNLAERVGPCPELARAYANMCLVAGFFSLRSLSNAYSRQAQETALTINHRPALAWVLEITGVYALGLGQWDKASDALGQAVGISSELEDRRRWEECLTALSEVAYLQGNFTDSLRLWPDIYASAHQYGDAQAQSWGLAGQLRCWLALDQIHTDTAATTLRTLEAVLAEDIGSADEINSYGVLGLAYLRLGEPDRARHAIDTVVRLITRSSPTGFGTIHGYSSAAEVYLSLWETELVSDPSASFRTAFRWPSLDFSGPTTRTLKSSAWESCQALHRFARVFPIGRPRAWLCQGLYYWLANKPVRAHRAWQKSLATAQRLAMPYEQGLAHYDIGCHLDKNSSARAGHLAQAWEIFRQLNATYDLRRSQQSLEIS